MKGRRARSIAAVVAVMLAAGLVVAWAFWTAPGAGSAPVSTGTLAAATIDAPTSATNSVTVTWSGQATLQPDPAQNSAITYSVERKLAAGAWAAVSGGDCSGAKPHGVTSCSDTPASAGSYTYRVVATFRSWTATSAEAGPVSLTIDTAGPTGGSVDAAGLVGTGGRYSTSTALSIVLDKGTDPSGLASSGAQLKRASAPLSSSDGADGSCGSFDPSVQIGADDPSSPVANSVPAGPACYRYEYVVADTAGNSTTYTSPDIKVDASAPAAPELAFSALTNAYWGGSTLFYRSDAGSGAFTLTASASDASGIASYALPSLPGAWTAANGAPGVRTYSWAAANPTAPSGAQNATATNHATLTSPAAGFTLTSDVTPPATGNVAYTSGYYGSSSVSVTFSRGTDSGGSGVDASSGRLQRAEAPLLAGGGCDTYGGFATVSGGTDPNSPFTDTSVTSGKCYQYRYLASDNVGNQATYTSASVAKVDTAAPSISRATVAKSDTSTAGAIRQGGSYYVYAQVTDNASVSSVSANTSSFDSGVTAASLTAQNFTVGGQSYNYRSAQLTADTGMTTGSTPSYTISATDAASNTAGPASYSATVETYASVIAATSGLVSFWRFNDDAAISADDFTDSAGTELSAHTGELSASWTSLAGQALTAQISNANRLRKQSGNGAAQYYGSAAPSSPNYLVEADVYAASLLATDGIGLVGRQDISGTGGTYYLARYVMDTAPAGHWELNKVVNGAATLIGTNHTQTLTAGSTYRLGLQMNGSTISLVVDGVIRNTGTDATTPITAAGRAGLRFGNGASTAPVSDTAGLHVDNFRMTNLSPPAADSKGTNHGTYTNGAQLSEPGALAGDSNRAVKLDGIDDYVSIPDAGSLDLGDGPLTLEAWVKRAGPVAGTTCLFDKGSLAYRFCYDSNAVYLLKNGTAGFIAGSTPPLTDASWHHLVTTKNGAASKVYIDGVDATSGGTNQTLGNSTAALMLGRLNPSGGNLPGVIDEFAVYNTVLSAATVLDHYKAGKGTG